MNQNGMARSQICLDLDALRGSFCYGQSIEWVSDEGSPDKYMEKQIVTQGSMMSVSKALPTLRQLIYFSCVAEMASFSKAAQKLNISQPPLTRQIHLLEGQIGVALFIRSSSGVMLTEAGELTLVRARHIISEVQKLSVEARKGKSDEIKVGFSRYLGPEWAVSIKQNLAKSFSRMHICPTWGASPDLLKLVKENALDAAVLGVPPETLMEEGLTKIGDYEHVIAISSSKFEQLTQDWAFEDLNKIPLFVQNESIFPAYSRFLNDGMKAISYQPMRRTRPDELNITLSLVSKDEGITLLPAPMANFNYPNLIFMKIPDYASRYFRLPICLALSSKIKRHENKRLADAILASARIAIN